MSAKRQKILIVEDSKFFSTAIRHKLSDFTDVDSYFATSYHDAEELIKQHDGDFFIALLDLCLPDAIEGQIVDLAHKHKIPSIIFSGNYDREHLDLYYSLGVIDCVSKETPASLDYFISLVRRLLLNRLINVLVVEDSTTARNILCSQLSRQKINVIEARDGQEALEKMESHGDIHLVLTDYNMPKIDGYALVNKLRAIYTKDQLPIIGMSSHDDTECAVRFLKLGANDFIHKPFGYEELLCRVSQNLDIYCLIEELKASVYKDSLTGLNNRRFLFEFGDRIFNSRNNDIKDIAVAMIDIDHFKNINDTHGHHVGDDVLARVSENLVRHLEGEDMIARFGGEEFCVIIQNKELDVAINILEKLRITVEEDRLDVDGEEIKVTVSIGVCSDRKPDFEAMLQTADNALYEAKNKGRNRLIQAA